MVIDQWYAHCGTTAGAASVIVAVIDTGFDLGHPDIAPKLWVNRGEIPGNGIDDDGNGERMRIGARALH
jgi:hypothetical protein